MIWTVHDGRIHEIAVEEVDRESNTNYLGIFTFDELDSLSFVSPNERELFVDVRNDKYAKFESGEGWDFVCLNLLNYADVTAPPDRVSILMRKGIMLFVAEKTFPVLKIISRFTADETKKVTFTKLLYYFMDQMTEKDSDYLDLIEQEISELEDDLMNEIRKSCVKEISALRKKLMILKHYYEQLFEVADEIQENENQLIDPNFMRYFKIFDSRLDRLYHSVLNLRDYVTQVREAYQAEVDISLNSIMKLFTVLTAIFMPLTLIVGWYGMNLRLPEFGWNYGYPFVILLCFVITVSSLIYFKKNNWF
jgi:magnesium transporter